VDYLVLLTGQVLSPSFTVIVVLLNEGCRQISCILTVIVLYVENEMNLFGE